MFNPADGDLTVGGNVSSAQFVGDVLTGTGSNNYTLNAKANVIVKQEFNSTNSNVAVINGDGYRVLTAEYTNKLSYSGSTDLKSFQGVGSSTSGSAVISVSDFGEISGLDGNTTKLSQVNQYMVYNNTTALGGSQRPFPIGTYVVSVDTGANTITLSQNAFLTSTIDNFRISPGAVDTSTLQAVAIESAFDNSGGSATTINNTNLKNADSYGYPESGYAQADFLYSNGNASDYTWASTASIMSGKTAFTADNAVIKATTGLVVGDRTSMSPRAEFDGFEGYGINVMWDGIEATNTSKTPQYLMKSYTDNSLASSTPQCRRSKIILYKCFW